MYIQIILLGPYRADKGFFFGGIKTIKIHKYKIAKLYKKYTSYNALRMLFFGKFSCMIFMYSEKN